VGYPGSTGLSTNRDINAAQDIRAEEIRMIAAGIAGITNGCSVSQDRGRKSSVLRWSLMLED